MSTRHVRHHLVWTAFLLWFAVVGCGITRSFSVNTDDEVRTETQSVDLGSAASTNVQIDMGAGVLKIQDGANSLMDATFRYNFAEWKPEVSYNVNGSQGELRVSQGDSKFPVGSELVNEWTILLDGSVPMDLQVHVGASEGNLDLGGLNLNNLEIETGAGSNQFDLKGSWDHDVNVAITGGAGAMTVNLPVDMGVRVTVDTGLVSLTTIGLEKDGADYVNQAYGTTPNTLFLNIDAGVGSVELRSQ